VATDDLVLTNGIFRLEFARRVTNAILADIPHDQWCRQSVPGANHAMWTAGHLAAVDDFFMGQVGGLAPRCPAGWNELFGTGSKLSTDPAAYPAPEAVQQQLAARRQELISWFGSLSGAELAAPMPEGLGRYAANVGELMPSIAWHEAYHTGQLNLVRKVLGLGALFK